MPYHAMQCNAHHSGVPRNEGENESFIHPSIHPHSLPIDVWVFPLSCLVPGGDGCFHGASSEVRHPSHSPSSFPQCLRPPKLPVPMTEAWHPACAFSMAPQGPFVSLFSPPFLLFWCLFRHFRNSRRRLFGREPMDSRSMAFFLRRAPRCFSHRLPLDDSSKRPWMVRPSTIIAACRVVSCLGRGVVSRRAVSWFGMSVRFASLRFASSSAAPLCSAVVSAMSDTVDIRRCRARSMSISGETPYY
mmetsp:Transcript_116660/g.238641  ORF Transcript_116660/g.238641 Transcript_116660/m.238641 type:complete len:245 (+) Transcript_116660:1054-1788(+)